MAIRPLSDRVVIQRPPAPETTAAGLVIPDVARERPPLGHVVATGRGRRTRAGTRVPPVVAVGDTVLFSAAGGARVTVRGTDLDIVRETDILAILEPLPHAATVDPRGGAPWVPPVDVTDGPDHVVVLIDLPGVDPGTLSLTLTGSALTLEGMRRLSRPVEAIVRHVAERRGGPFQRTLELHRPVVAAGVQATFEAGVLTIRLPKAESARTRRVAVERA